MRYAAKRDKTVSPFSRRTNPVRLTSTVIGMKNYWYE